MGLGTNFTIWLARAGFGIGRLDGVPLIPVGAPVREAFDTYGRARTTEPHGYVRDATVHTFHVDALKVGVTEWRGRVHAIAFRFPGRIRDTDFTMLTEHYAEGAEWRALTEGERYERSDGHQRCWLGPGAVVGFGTAELMTAAPPAPPGGGVPS